MSAIMDLSRGAGIKAELSSYSVIERCAAILGADPATLLLAANLAAARDTLTCMDKQGDESRLSEGVAALLSPSCQGVTLYRLGFDLAAPVLISSPEMRLAAKPGTESPPKNLYFGPEILARLTPAALAAAKAEWDERLSLTCSCAQKLGELTGAVADNTGDSITLRSDEKRGLANALAAIGLKLEETDEGFTAWLFSLAEVKALAAHLGGLKPARTARIRRTTKETDIALFLDLDGEPGGRFETGVFFFDHMLEQIARHGGVRLEVVCEGDVEVDTHHTIEDVCLALGEAIRVALGDKAGIARFGFALPMDETRAGVWVDLSGRPYVRFDGDIPGERVGDFPVEMCAHAFRSLSETMKAAIHVEVTGDNAHHMIEACFKAFGRALRQGVRVEGNVIPSTKGVL